VYIVAITADNLAKTTIKSNGTDFHHGWITGVLALLLLLPSLAVLFRRLHDSGHSGWWWLLIFVCGIGGIIVFIFTLFDSKPDNKWEPNPKTSIA
jgi:uncharacterized membrane protein YhaH (DUF805 family)